jgi:cytochrome c oxidase assembly factor CtaG
MNMKRHRTIRTTGFQPVIQNHGLEARGTSAVLIFAIMALMTRCVLAHEVESPESLPHNYHELWRTWAWEPGTVIPLALSAWLYAQGLWRTWRAAGYGHGIKPWQAASFAAGWMWLVIALISPLHPWGQVLFWPHMAQHEILMLVAAPLLVLGQPMAVFLRALPARWSRALASFGNAKPWLAFWRWITLPLAAWAIHGAALWIWHIPALFEATLHSEFIHALQHLSFLLSALLFWWAVIHGRQRKLAYGMAILYMFTTAMHSGLLGAMLTLADVPWYRTYAQTAPQWGVSALEDQQLGGLIMWVPAGLVYTAVALALFAAWLAESERRAQRNDRLMGSILGHNAE